MNMSFNQLKTLELKSDMTAELTLHDIENPDGTSPTLILAPATEANKGYFNGLLRRSRKNMRNIQEQNFDTSMIENNRDNDRVLYAKYIVKGWKHVKDDKGKDVPFNEENAQGFLEALPYWLFDKVRNFATVVRNFVDIDVPDAEATAKNLQEG